MAKKNIILKLTAGAIAGLAYSLFYFSGPFKEKTILYLILGFLMGISVAVSNKIRAVDNILYAVLFGTLGGFLVMASYSYIAELTIMYPVAPFLIISIFISLGLGLAEKSLIKLSLRLIVVLMANFLIYAVLALAILKTYGFGFGKSSYEEIQMSIAFIIIGAMSALSIGVGDFFERDIIFSRIFWIVTGIGIVLLWFFRHWLMNIDGFLFFLPIVGGYALPLIVPALLFRKGLGGRKQPPYFTLGMMSLIIWFFWAWFRFNVIDDITSARPWGKAMFMCLLIVFIGVSTLCLIRYHNRLAMKNNFTPSINKRFLWRTWFVGFGTIIAAICLYQLALEIPGYLRFGFSLDRLFFHIENIYYDIYDPIGLSLQWLILTLPATLKMNKILSKTD